MPQITPRGGCWRVRAPPGPQQSALGPGPFSLLAALLSRHCRHNSFTVASNSRYLGCDSSFRQVLLRRRSEEPYAGMHELNGRYLLFAQPPLTALQQLTHECGLQGALIAISLALCFLSTAVVPFIRLFLLSPKDRCRRPNWSPSTARPLGTSAVMYARCSTWFRCFQTV